MFVDRAQKTILLDNTKEALSVEKRVLALEKKSAIEERKQTKQVTFKDESKKNTSKYPFDLEGL